MRMPHPSLEGWDSMVFALSGLANSPSPTLFAKYAKKGGAPSVSVVTDIFPLFIAT